MRELASLAFGALDTPGATEPAGAASVGVAAVELPQAAATATTRPMKAPMAGFRTLITIGDLLRWHLASSASGLVES